MKTWNNQSLPEESWKQLDKHIINHEILKSIKFSKQELNLSLPKAIEFTQERHLYLRETNPSEFKVSLEDYYKDSYS